MTYTPEQKAEALRLYAEVGPSEAARQTGIPKSTVESWARRTGARTVATEQTRAATEAVRAESLATRERIRSKVLQRADRVLDRMVEQYEEFVGKDGDHAIYKEPPGDALRNMAIAFATLLDKYRLEMGESTARAELDVRGRVAAVAERMGLDPDEVMAEAESILRSGK